MQIWFAENLPAWYNENRKLLKNSASQLPVSYELCRPALSKDQAITEGRALKTGGIEV
jgi:hypothetical protein